MQVNSSGNPTTGSICNSRLGVVCHWPYSSCHFQLILGLGLSIEDANVIHSAMTSNSAGRSQMPMKQIASALNDQALTNCAQLLSKNLLKICRVCLFFFFFKQLLLLFRFDFIRHYFFCSRETNDAANFCLPRRDLWLDFNWIRITFQCDVVVSK